jgi:hypothetical protein
MPFLEPEITGNLEKTSIANNNFTTPVLLLDFVLGLGELELNRIR